MYLAQDSKHERVVALKILHPELAASLGSHDPEFAWRKNDPRLQGLVAKQATIRQASR